MRLTRKKTPEYQHVAVILQKGDQILIGKRPANGLLGGLWEFPELRLNQTESPLQGVNRLLEKDLSASASHLEPFATVAHAFTHFKMTVDVFWAQTESLTVKPTRHVDYRWVTTENLREYPFAGAQNKFLSRVIVRSSSAT